MSAASQYLKLIEKIDPKYHRYLFGGVLLVVAVVNYCIFIGPSFSELSKISPIISEKSQQLKLEQIEIKKKAYYNDEIAAYKEKIQGLHHKVKTRDDMPMILENISRVAGKHDLKIDGIMPNIENQEELLENNNVVYFSLPIVMEAHCSYHNFGEFLNEIETDYSYLSVGKIDISKLNNTRLNKVKLTLNATVYENIN